MFELFERFNINITREKMKTKYTDEAIENALSEYKKYSLIEPTINSIKSKYYQLDTPTSFIIYKRYNLYNNPLMPHHVYIMIDGRSYHPGSPNDEIFQEGDPDKGQVTGVEEICKYCVYHRLQTLFKNDKQFNIFTNNCQIVLGNSFNTILIWCFVGMIILFIVSGIGIFFFFSLALFLQSFLYGAFTSNVTNNRCIHIIDE